MLWLLVHFVKYVWNHHLSRTVHHTPNMWGHTTRGENSKKGVIAQEKIDVHVTKVWIFVLQTPCDTHTTRIFCDMHRIHNALGYCMVCVVVVVWCNIVGSFGLCWICQILAVPRLSDKVVSLGVAVLDFLVAVISAKSYFKGNFWNNQEGLLDWRLFSCLGCV